jgi:hypothetical protein
MLKLFRGPSSSNETSWFRSYDEVGVRLSRTPIASDSEALNASLLDGFITQLNDDGAAVETEGTYHVCWDALYEAVQQEAYAGLFELLALPQLTNCRPCLQSANSLTDDDFSIAIGGWLNDTHAVTDWEQSGPILTIDEERHLMRPEQWWLVKEITSFARRGSENRTDIHNRQGWSRIRQLARASRAAVDDFLHRSVVLTPERLGVRLRRSDVVGDDRLVEIEPSFEGAPAGWLEAFDRNQKVPDRYDVLTPEGIVQVLVTPAVKTVLEQIRRLPGRRIAGTRAQAFLLNPFATLGEAANRVIDEAQFEQAREEAGLHYERFVPVFERNATGYPLRVGLLIDTASARGPVTSETHWLDDEGLGAFIRTLVNALSMNYQLVAWNGFDLEIQGDTPGHLAELQAALEARRQHPTLVSYAQVHDLSTYSSRIEGIGVEKPYYSPFIAKKKDEEGWFPDNVIPVVVYQLDGESEPIAVPASPEAISRLKKSVEAAREAGESSVDVSWLPGPLSISEAQEMLGTFDSIFADLAKGQFDLTKPLPGKRERTASRKSLLLRGNIGALEYEERRQEALATFPAEPQVPKSLRAEYSLLPHQRQGLAWMQHLYSLQTEYQVRGAVLGDDMGLGKTYQLLALMACLIENNPNIEPMLVVAPVSLLENWAEEAKKFFVPGALPLLTAYGEGLSDLRVPRAQVEQRLRDEDGLVRFLRPNWVGSAKVVLTTYETLRDLEFSFATQRWSLMVCDEAQRIKNPAAMVTRAAKKQNVGFKIACTGTPVENTLADMWCLFDFVQPGLLGALNDFGLRYRKPIEAKTDDERARVAELRARIAPQILRRMKAEVAKNLPNKIVDPGCRKLTISSIQRNLYTRAVENFKRRGDGKHTAMFKNHLGLLHHLRLICTDPRPYGLNVFKPEPIAQYRARAPKLDWLLTQLGEVKKRREKVIIFCEFREIQRLLQHYIGEAFEVRPDIINGDTSASATHTASRQKRIKAFQEKPGFGVLILSPVAVGFGVNIQAANHVVHYTRTWNPAKEDQATDRAYRIGQTKDVYVYYPAVFAEDFVTFDIKLDQLLTYKRELSEDMLNGSGDLGPGEFNIADLVSEADAKDMDERVTLDMALRMSWQSFECLAGVLWSKRGFAVYRTPGTRDNGVDVVAIAGTDGELIQTKTSSIDGQTLSWDAVKDVVGGEAFYKRLHPNVTFKKICLTNQYFNRQAHEQAALNAVELLEQNHLEALLHQYGVTILEVEKVLCAEWNSPD